MSLAEHNTWATAARTAKAAGTGYTYFLSVAQANLLLHHGLCAYYSLNAIIAGQVLDLSGQGNTGVLKPSYPADAPLRADGPYPGYGQALGFDGAGDHIDCDPATSAPTGNQDRTLEAWINPLTPTPGADNIAIWLGGINTRQITSIGVRGATSTFYLAFWADDLDIPLTATVGQWYHLAGTYRGDTRFASLYVDGKLQGTRTLAGDLNTGQFLFVAGNFPHNQFLHGSLDDVRVYNRVLSPVEISAHYRMFQPK